MTPTFRLNTSEFQEASRQALIQSRRELSVAVNARVFFVALKAFKLMKPHDAKAKKAEIRRSLEAAPTRGRNLRILRKSLSRLKRRTIAHLIVQKNRRLAGKPGLYGEEMAEAARRFIKRRMARVGYLRSVFAGIQRKFNRFARQRPVGRKHRAVRERHQVAVPGINPLAIMDSTIPVKGDQMGKVAAEYRHGLAGAMASETIEMKEQVRKKMQQIADQYRGR